MKFKINPEFDKRYDIRLANLDDVPLIMKFIDKCWRKGHIMSRSRVLFDYEYVHETEVDFVIAIDKFSKDLEGIFGFIRCQKERNQDIWGSMWKVRDDHDNMKLLGIELARRVYILTGCRMHIGNGANPNTTIPLRKIFFREKTAKMKQFYRLNREIKDYKIALIKDEENLIENVVTKLRENYSLKKIDNFKELENSYNLNKTDIYPVKDAYYIKHRYFEHPFYNYLVYGIEINGQTSAVIFLRQINIMESSVLRIVDFLGDEESLLGISPSLDNLMQEKKAEYVDFYQFGLEDDILRKAGFINREDTKNIIPNYFEPFLQENADIWVHYTMDNTRFFKADGDQDRPNQLN
ncbi:hypothetical protein [Lachnospira pectinoschiza]|uniref:Uncharacterized protein n=1 Tax=Lachnospira pectinoschiza TaxID=28052 RepID=A0A1G9WZ61_9FIRM|nr:hypothetical protein [Lachnospira pectinoschiza]SDM89531.1 hypothetical protein SAMN05216544_1394 [Lachnospira pectinoschiza]